MGKSWEKWEEELLKSKLEMSLRDLEPLFPERSIHSIRWKAIQLGKTNWTQKQTYRTAEEEQEIINCYSRLQDCVKVSEEMGHNDRGKIVLYVLGKHGIKTKGRRYSRSCRKDIPTYIERDLENDLKFKYYLLGAVATDGHLNTKDNSVTFQISAKDNEWLQAILEKMVDNLNPKTNINTRMIRGTEYETSSVNVHLPKFVEFATSLGMTQHKTYSLNLNLDGIDSELFLYFFRGLIDGDGSVSVPRGKKGDINVHPYTKCHKISLITASLQFAVFLAKKMRTDVKISVTHKQHFNKELGYVFKQVFNGNKAKALALLLPCEDYMLKRKTDKILLVRESTAKNKKYKWVENREEAKELFGL